MGRKNQGVRLGAIFVWALAMILPSCATVQDVQVLYRMPDPSKELAGKRVFIDFQDRRQDREVLGPRARQEFTYHSGNVDLILSQGNDPAVPAGSTDVPSLFRKVFGKRIQNLGGEVVRRPADADVALEVSLESFSLDLKERTWVARMTYEARVGRNGEIMARRSMTGEAERARILGLKQAHQVMGELFTDVVNRLDIRELIQKGGL